MTTTAPEHGPSTVDDELAAEAAEISRHAHPSDGTYVLIAFALAALTAIEVAIYYLKSSTLITTVLIVLMMLKFSIVVLFFMHLRFDSKVLRRLFTGGLVLACFIYIVVLFVFGIFHV